MPVDHEFGGQHTELKLSIVESYLKAYTKALRNKFDQLWYIDAFAGTGTRTIRTRVQGFLEPPHDRIEIRRGSAQIALDVKPSFDRYLFVETNPTYCEELKRLASRYPKKEIVISQLDANEVIRKQAKWPGWKSARGVLFLDPYGMEVEWATLEAVARTEAIDVWFLFPLAGLYRQATRSLKDIDDHKRAALTRMFGTDAWERELYSEPGGFFPDLVSKQREMTVKGLERYVQRRLETIFAKVLPPLPLPIDRGPQRYSLFLCISNNDPKAIGLASKIGGYILKAGISSKVRP